jgi:transposase-like protein
MRKTTIRYSESFKLQVIREIESGRFDCVEQAREHYGIKGMMTIAAWLRKFGKNELMPKLVRVESPNERDEMKRLQQRVRELEAALADKELDLRLEKAYVSIACERAGIEDVEGFKKKHAGRPPTTVWGAAGKEAS